MIHSDWASLSESQQFELIIEWHRNGQWEVYADMAEEAARLLKRELQLDSDVTNVHVGGGVDILIEKPITYIRESVLNVCTLFHGDQKIEKLAAKFCGFRVVQLNLGESRDAFVNTFTFVMKELRGWTNAETLKWVNEGRHEPLDDSLSGGFLFSPVYSRGPVSMAASAIIQDCKKDLPSGATISWVDLYGKIRTAIWDATRKAGSREFYHPDRAQNVDWQSVKTKINDIIKQAPVKAGK